MSIITALSAKLHVVLDRLDKLERSGETQNVKHDDAFLKQTEQQKSIEAMEQAPEHMSDNYDEILKTTQANKTRLKELEEKSALFDAALSEQQSEMDKLKSTLNSLEEYSQRKTLKFMALKKQ